MLKTGLLAGALMAGFAIPALAAPALAEAPRHPGGETAGVHGCRGESQDWLPGALQIDERAAPERGGAAGQAVERAPAAPDCALV